jgi:PAS domain S-box-containing protein
MPDNDNSYRVIAGVQLFCRLGLSRRPPVLRDIAFLTRSSHARRAGNRQQGEGAGFDGMSNPDRTGEGNPTEGTGGLSLEEALREREQQLRNLADNLPNVMVYQAMATPDGGRRFTFVGRGVERLNGITVEELLADAAILYRQMLPEYQALVSAREEEALKNLSTLHVEVQSRLPDGRIRWFEYTSVPRYLSDGTLVWDGVEVDITARKEFEAELERRIEERTAALTEANLRLTEEVRERAKIQEVLRDSEERYRHLIDSTGTGFSVLDENGMVLEANAAFARMAGVDNIKEIIGKTIFQWFSPEDAHKNAEAVARGFREGGIQDFETHVIQSDGRHADVLVNATLRVTAAGKYLVALCRDITMRKQAEAERQRLESQLQHTQKLESLGVLAGGIAHDFNNILHIILGNVHQAQKVVSEVSPACHFIDNIEKSAIRAATLTRQMLAYSGRGNFLVQTVDLGEIVGEIIQLIRSSVSKKVALTMNSAKLLPAIEADAAQIQQVAMNLILNASEALDEENGGEVTVSVMALHCTEEDLCANRTLEKLPEGEYVCLEVADTGCGMGPETLDRLFDPFFTTKFTGRGLGMSAVLGIMRGHKGAILVESTPGAGTTVRAHFPASAHPVPIGTKNKRASSHTAPDRPFTILFVDDEPEMLELGAMALEQKGFTVLTAGDGLDAVELFKTRTGEIDCVLLDLCMPRMDGVETLMELRRVKPGIPAILASGYAEQELRTRLTGQEVGAIIEKPYNFADLAAKLRKLLG